MKVRTRFAPSPTGFIHLGAIRTVLYNYALAKQNKGQFIIRLEDTDRKRLVEGAEAKLYEIIKAYGMNWDEGPDVGGPFAPYKQSERLEMYKKTANELVEKDFAYYAFDTIERLTKLKEEQEKAGIRTHYDKRDRNLDKEEVRKRVESGESYCIRLKIPDNESITFEDPITKKKISWETKDLDDIILLKSDGYPTYHLAVVVDDVAMEITHVFRGPEWISTTPYHVYLYNTLKLVQPLIIHVTVIFDPRTGKKFSKRDLTGAFLAEKYLKEGYLPEAVMNYLMLLGWAPKDNREIFSLDEFVESFNLEGLQKANPVFNQKKLDWFAGQYIRKLEDEELIKKVKEWQVKYSEGNNSIDKIELNDKSKIVIGMIKERSITLKEIYLNLNLLLIKPETIKYMEAKGVKDKDKEEILKVNEDLLELMKSLNVDSYQWDHSFWEKSIREIAKKFNWKDADVFMLLRLSIWGVPFSPPLFEIMQYLGQEEVVFRIESLKTKV